MDLLTTYSGLFLRVGLYPLIFWPTVGYYVYHDSKQRGIASPRLRGIFNGFFRIAGIAVYLVQKERAKTGSNR